MNELILLFDSRNMLSAAHVLAMDAKNLLDVIDSIRNRFPNLFNASEGRSSSNKSTPNNSATSSPSRKLNRPQQQQQQQPPLPPPNRILSPSIEQAATENQYQNLSGFNLPLTSTTNTNEGNSSHGEGLYANEQQKPLYDMSTSGGGAGGELVSQQIKALELGDEKRIAGRPQLAAKPFNFNIVKVKSNFGGNNNNNGSGGAGGGSVLANELKIIEDDLVLGTGEGGGVKLPEPVSCSIVQENIFKKNQSVLHNNQ